MNGLIEKCRKIQILWCLIIYCMSFWVSKGNWFKLDHLVYYAHPYLITGGLTSHCLLDLRFDFSFRIGAKIFFEFFFISSLYGYFKFHFLKKNISPFGIKICKFLYLREVCLCNFPHYFHKNRIQISVVEILFLIFFCVCGKVCSNSKLQS